MKSNFIYVCVKIINNGLECWIGEMVDWMVFLFLILAVSINSGTDYWNKFSSLKFLVEFFMLVYQLKL